jgi:hypothetical protein
MDEYDECWYFTRAKKIKIYSPLEFGKKVVVIVHAECLRQIDFTKQETSPAAIQSGSQASKTEEVNGHTEVVVGKKRLH